jgi:enterochelin esterase-like enzyme
LLILIISKNYAWEGRFLRNQVFTSTILNQSIFYNVYLPAGYSADKEYPVLFYLHWFGGDHHSANDLMLRIDQLIGEKIFPELVIISPDAKHEFRVNDGGHDGNCVNSSLADALDFLKKHLK